ETDAHGEAAMLPCAFPVVVEATWGSGRSAPVVVEPGGAHVVLLLRGPRRALGTVQLPAAFRRGSELRVDAFQQLRGSVGRRGLVPLATATVNEIGAWGPIAVAADRERELVFRLRGGGVIPVERAVDPRIAVSPLVVDFRPEL